MDGIGPNDPQAAARAMAASASRATAPVARPGSGTQQAPRQTGFSPVDRFESATRQLNSGSAGRSGLVNSNHQAKNAILGKSNLAYSRHQLIMELNRLLRPS
jgi:hypothetical protein